jgi:hypothetical protein
MKFGRLTVLELHPKRRRYGSNVHPLWRCVCDCGSGQLVLGESLRSGRTTSCGCWNRERVRGRFTKHGHAKPGNRTRAYQCWDGMRQRCSNPNCPAYPNYGGRGIRVCDDWEIFENFFADMGHPPRGRSLDRIDVNGNYEPSNCRWATILEQARNKRPTRRSSDDYDGAAP